MLFGVISGIYYAIKLCNVLKIGLQTDYFLKIKNNIKYTFDNVVFSEIVIEGKTSSKYLHYRQHVNILMVIISKNIS